jgi:hypothetical protein
VVRTIALEEHFTTKELATYAAGISSIAQPGVWAEALRLLLDVTAARLRQTIAYDVYHGTTNRTLRPATMPDAGQRFMWDLTLAY